MTKEELMVKVLAAEPASPNNDEVICPSCTRQFRAIPVNVQHLLLDAGFAPPFMQLAAPTQVGEYPKLPEPAMFDAVDRQGNPVSHGYSASQVLALIDADRAARGQTLRLLTQEEMDSLGRRAEGMDGNEWDQWVQEKFAQVNGLKVQGGSHEWDRE